MSKPASTLESNKAAVRRFKESQGTRDEDAALRELLAPGYTRQRGGMVNLALLKQLGTQLPPRKDGRLIVPPVTDAGEDGDVVVNRLMAMPPVTQEDRNKLKVARSKSSFVQKEDRANFVQKRWGLQHMRDYGEANGVVQFDPSHAFPGRNDRITGLLAEGSKVWMKFNLRGTNTQSFYGLPPTGRRCEMTEVSISTFVGDTWAEGWVLADGVGILLQLDALHMLAGLGCQPLR